MSNLARLRSFVQDMTRLAERHGADEPRMLDEGARLLKDLVSHDDWLPEAYAAPSPESYRQYLLYCDPLERFSVVSFVWMPGHRTPIHDHTVWGLVGVMRGAEMCEEYSPDIKKTKSHEVKPGQVDRVSPRIGDVHVVSNAGAQTAVSIHVYGANIGAVRRHTYDPASGQPREFVSGYHNAAVPNLWDRSKE
ncbi:MAG TPA: cysteine dioxygenase [Burkholderiales bacterium]|jgi:predicted metal-dependent enzyme (double-stranded beta helix superfamily)|nr:cysteine dioxygenase [Burkholderiales bacterium]